MLVFRCDRSVGSGARTPSSNAGSGARRRGGPVACFAPTSALASARPRVVFRAFCNAITEIAQLGDVRTTAEANRVAAPGSLDGVYRANVAVVTAYFARRCSEPQTVADLTSETFLEAIESFRTFDARKGSPRAWLFGIARHIYAKHCAAAANGRQAAFRLAAQLTLDDDETEQLAAKIDDQRVGRRLLARCARLPEIDRAAIELVDLSGLSLTEAATVLQLSSGALRVRLFRARARLRKGADKP